MPQLPPTTLDPSQLTRIEAVHRGFLYQHLFAVGCLLFAAKAGASAIIVEADEDIEVVLPDGRVSSHTAGTMMPPLLRWLV
jgi:hypothetical protein